jgi:lysophospholipase L1-like esterase
LFIFSSFTLGGDTSGEMPAFREGNTILFQGDSITDGNRGRGLDPNHILGHGYQFIIAAKFGGRLPSRHLSFLNRGVSGNTVADLQKRWEKDTLALKPDILSILIGVNDLNRGASAEQYEQGSWRMNGSAWWRRVGRGSEFFTSL